MGQAIEQDFIERTYADMRSSISKKYKNTDPDLLELVFNLIHTADKAQNKWAESAQSLGLSFTGFNVLGLLDHKRTTGLPLNEVSRLLLVSRPNVTGLIDSLERKGLVARVDHKTDRRIYLARITKKGETLLNAYRPLYFSALKKMSGRLNGKEMRALIELLRKWRDGMESTRQDR